MRFELAPNNYGASDDVLLDDLRDVATKLMLASVSRDEYQAHGRFHPKTLVKRFESWNRTLELAGLRVRKIHLVSEAELLEDMKRVAQLLCTDSLTLQQYKQHG